MIRGYKYGNLIDLAKAGNYDNIAHGCNCMCTMKSGIAPQIADAFPEAWEADQATEKGAVSKLGTFSKGSIVYNLYTQYTFTGRRRGIPDIDYKALADAFRALNDDMGSGLLGIPKIGAGLAGGDWDTIERLINENTPNIDIEVVLWKAG